MNVYDHHLKVGENKSERLEEEKHVLGIIALIYG
jgi:hypothetical protein